jgi:hypothetical protein
MNIVWVFVDGLGLGVPDPLRNPCLAGGIELLRVYESGNGLKAAARGGLMAPTDAVLGVDGLPQSATGQTALFTGVDAPKLLGRHLPGYPNEALRAVLREHSVLKKTVDLGLRAAFINAYRPLFFSLKEKTKWRLSATTVATLAAGLPFFGLQGIAEGECLYHDFTNAFLIQKRFDVPLFSSEEAGKRLGRIAGRYDLVLYEYFLTDRAGHRQDLELSVRVLNGLDRFLVSLLETVDRSHTLLLVTSDHGNVEDLSVKTHTRNRVPTLAWGKRSDRVLENVRAITDITPAVLALLQDAQPPEGLQ